MSGAGAVRTAAAVASLLALVALAACAPTAPDEPDAAAAGLDRFSDQELNWGECAPYATNANEAVAFEATAEVAECARLEVPLDYDRPDRDVESVAVVRVEALGDAIGPLLMNPGGPGGSGLVGAIGAAAALVDSPIAQRFDMVGFDPRGVGATRPTADCFSDDDIDSGDELFRGIGSVAPQLTEDDTRAVAERCAEGSGGDDALAQMGSRTTARDMDVLRAVLGHDELSFLGQSYGTRLGTVYAEQFPDRVRAMVLDGAFDPTLGTFERRLGAYEGFQEAFDAMAAQCATQPDCALGTDPEGWTDAFHSLVQPLREAPIPALDAQLGFDEAVGGVISGLYSPGSWPRIIAGLAEVSQGRGDELLQLTYDFGGRDENGVWPNFAEANFAINCMDEQRLTLEQGAELRTRTYEIAPFMDPGVDVTDGARDACEFWPAEPSLGIPYGTDIQGLPDTLVVSFTNDPTTPYPSAVVLAETLGSALLTVEGAGHTVVAGGTNACVDEIASAYLIDLEVPAEGATCASP